MQHHVIARRRLWNRPGGDGRGEPQAAAITHGMGALLSPSWTQAGIVAKSRQPRKAGRGFA
jgi:hypothetical protein